MDNNVNGQLTCHIQTDLLREDSAPYDFGFEVTCIAEPSPDNGPKRRKVGSLKGFTYFPGSLTRESDLDGAYDLFDSRNDSVLDGYTLLRKRRLALARAATNGKSTNLKGIRGVVFCEQLFVNPAVRSQGLGLRLLREISQLFAASQALMLLKAGQHGQPEGEGNSNRLTNYLLSDTTLTLGVVRSSAFPGWMAGLCDPSRACETDDASVFLNVHGIIQDFEELTMDDY